MTLWVNIPYILFFSRFMVCQKADTQIDFVRPKSETQMDFEAENEEEYSFFILPFPFGGVELLWGKVAHKTIAAIGSEMWVVSSVFSQVNL